MEFSSFPKHTSQLAIRHTVPDELDVTYHEVLNEEIVHTGASDDVWQVGQFLDEDDAVIAGRRQAGCDGVSNDDGDQDGNAVGDLASHLKDNDGNGDGMCDSTGKSSSTDSGISTRNDETNLGAVPESLRKPDMHCLTQHSAKTSSDLEGRNESSCWNRKREGQDGEAKGGEDVAGQRYKDAVSVRVLPDWISCKWRNIFSLAAPRPLSSSPCVKTPSKVDFPTSADPRTQTLRSMAC